MNAMVSVGPKKELGQDGHLLLLPWISFLPSRGSDIIAMVKKSNKDKDLAWRMVFEDKGPSEPKQCC